MSTLRILLADDHGVMRAGLRSMLESQADLEVVGEAESADEAVRLARELHPDVAIIDVRMPGDGLVATRHIKAEQPHVNVLILSQYDDPAYLNRALAAGAGGYALKRSSGQDLLQALRIVAKGEVYLHPAVARVLVEQSWQPSPASPPNSVQSLSERERQVLRLVALGHTSQQIGQQLFLSIRTVETYKLRGMEKLGITDRATLVRFAMSNGLLDAEPDR